MNELTNPRPVRISHLTSDGYATATPRIVSASRYMDVDNYTVFASRDAARAFLAVNPSGWSTPPGSSATDQSP